MTGTGRACVTGVALALVMTACGGDPGASGDVEPTASATTPTPSMIHIPQKPATDRLYADLRQSSRDAALGRMQVWVRNDYERDLTPTRVIYTDGRFTQPLRGGRLRTIPGRSIRGYTLTLPGRPACGSPATSGRVLVEHDRGREEMAVEDEADVVARYVASRCFERRVAAVATLSWADDVPADRPGEGGIGTLTLRVRPTGAPGARLTIDSVAGTPLLSSYRQPVWTPDLTVRGTDPPTTVELQVHPARCDEHVFMEAGSATAFRVKLRVEGPDGEAAGELILRMSPAGASTAISYARDSCGY